MNDADLGTSGVSEAVVAAHRVTGDLELAVTVVEAVIPVLLAELEPLLEAKDAEIASARTANAHVRDEIRAISAKATRQSRQLMRVFEEINPDSVAEQVLAKYRTGGHQPDGRDRAFARMTVRHTIDMVCAAIQLSLAVDERTWQDPRL